MPTDLSTILLTYGPGGVIAVALILGILVPKKFYEREVIRGDNATEAASKNADSLKNVSDALKVSTDALTKLRDEVSELKEEVRALREDLRAIRSSGGIKA